MKQEQERQRAQYSDFPRFNKLVEDVRNAKDKQNSPSRSIPLCEDGLPSIEIIERELSIQRSKLRELLSSPPFLDKDNKRLWEVRRIEETIDLLEGYKSIKVRINDKES